MKTAGYVAAAVLALSLLARADIERYRGLIELRRGEALMLFGARDANRDRRDAYFRASERDLTSARDRIPYDCRPAYLLATIAALRGHATLAIDLLRQSLSIEERPETDLNLSLNLVTAGNPNAASAAALRAAWLSPSILDRLPPYLRVAGATVETRVGKLRAGDRSAIPDLAPSDAAARDHGGNPPGAR